MNAAGWTYGVELEWPDVDCTAALPDGWAWSATDYTIVNSNGVANDPRRRLVLHGGELNSPPADSPSELAEACAQRWKAMRPGWNYRSNLHIHVRVPGLESDVAALQRIASYTRAHLPAALPSLDPLIGLLEGLTDPDELTAAIARRRHSERSRHYFLPAHRHAARMAASAVPQALAAEVPRTRQGRPAWALASREAVNLRSLRKHGTVEFRCFAAPREGEHIYAAACFARDWLHAALTDADPAGPVTTWAPALPKQPPFDARLERGWRYTNFKHNKRSTVAARLQELGAMA